MKRAELSLSACAAVVAITGAAGAIWSPAPAQAAWDWTRHCFKKADVDVLHGLVAKMLKEAPVGSRQSWCSTTGRQGFVYLVSGGEKAGAETATIRITTLDGRAERQWFVFRYRKDPVRGWGIVG